MVKRLDSDSRGILEFQPDIRFVEPDARAEQVRARTEDPQLEDIVDKRRRVKQIGKAVSTLATAIQSVVDLKAKNLKIKLDEVADAPAIAAMSRKFPSPPAGEEGVPVNPTVISYDQYKTVKEDLRKLGNKIGKKTIIDPDTIAVERDDAALAQLNQTSRRMSAMGGYNTDSSFNGSLRPELQETSVIIPPINIPEIQIDLICILINFVWKNFIKPTLANAAPPLSWAVNALPDQICDPGTIDLPGLYILGDNSVPDILTGKAAQRKIREVGVEAEEAGAGTL